MYIRRSLDQAFLLAILLCLTLAGQGFAGPACPDPASVTQPDRSSFTAVIRGDEFQSWVETDAGYTVLRNARTGFWEYAVPDGKGGLRLSGVSARGGKARLAGLTRHLKPVRDVESEKSFAADVLRKSGGQLHALGTWNPQPVSGQRKLLVILVEFANRGLSTTPAAWNTAVFDTTPGAKSVANYYKDNSFGTTTVTPAPHAQSGSPAGVVKITLPINHPNYGSYYSFSAEAPWVNGALTEAAKSVTFSSFDANHDGALQDTELLVYFVCAGYESSGAAGKTPGIWSHNMGGSGVYAGGLALRSWAVSGELNGYSVQQPMGTMAHELGHEMCGLPDLYDTTGTNWGLGGFSVMARGCWGRAWTETYPGTTPVAMDAWSRQYTGWSSPRVLSGGAGVTFGPALSSAGAAVKLVNNPLSNTQYFLVENRYPSGWDVGLEKWLGRGWGGGLLIMHIDMNVGTPGANDINSWTSGGHQGVVAEEASTVYGSMLAKISDGNASEGSLYHLFWNGNNAAFTDSTAPSSRLYDGCSTSLGLCNISGRQQVMTADIVAGPPASSVSMPLGGSTLHGLTAMITGTAQDMSGTGLASVDVSTDGGASWRPATGTTQWASNWTLPINGAYVIKSRARDNRGTLETPGAGVAVSVDNGGSHELPHSGFADPVTGKACGLCHQKTATFLGTGYLDESAFCCSCHNAGGRGHSADSSGGEHPIYVDVSTTWTKKPTYGDVTTVKNDNRMYAHLKGGRQIICSTCHNPMYKYEDYGRQWELTTTTDNTTYLLQRGGWSFMGIMVPKVYRDKILWGGPSTVLAREDYLVSPGEYTYDEDAGTITFKAAQTEGTYIYVTLDYPYLRVSSMSSRICIDCHTEATHMGANCLSCHEAHHTSNLSGIRETVRTTDLSEKEVVFTSRTGTGSFADGGPSRNGICEVCHTKTRYDRRDASGFSNHSGGPDYDGRDCTGCHSHKTGFSAAY